MRTAIGYMRVSTVRQGQSGIGLNAQRIQIEQYAKDRGIKIKKFFTEVASATGTEKAPRPAFKQAYLASKQSKCPILVASLDRVSRNTAAIEGLVAKIRVNILVANLDAEANDVILRSEIKKAQFVGEQISKRTKEARQARKDSGVKLGNPNLKEAQIKGAFTNRQLAIARHSDFEVALDRARDDGAVTAKEIAAAFNKMGVQTARGGLWTPENIYRQIGKQKERMTPEPPPASSAPTFADPDGILTPDGLKRLRAAMAANKMKPGTTGKLMNAIGFNRYDTSVGPGLIRFPSD